MTSTIIGCGTVVLGVVILACGAPGSDALVVLGMGYVAFIAAAALEE